MSYLTNKEVAEEVLCNKNCRFLSLTEEEQDKQKGGNFREPHLCLLFNKQVRHLNSHPNLVKCDMCREFKFVLIGQPADVKSLNDFDTHFISADKLRKLYNLPSSLCVLAEDEDVISYYQERINPFQIILHPRPTGEYEDFLMFIIDDWNKTYGY